MSHWARYKPLILTQSAPSAQPEHWLLRKQTGGQPSLTASVADIDVAKAVTASTKGKHIVRATMSSDQSEGEVGRHLTSLRCSLWRRKPIRNPRLDWYTCNYSRLPPKIYLVKQGLLAIWRGKRCHLLKQVQCQVHCHLTRFTPSTWSKLSPIYFRYCTTRAVLNYRFRIPAHRRRMRTRYHRSVHHFSSAHWVFLMGTMEWWYDYVYHHRVSDNLPRALVP